MTSSNRLPLVGGVVQPQRLVVPPEVIRGLTSYRHACRLAWKLRAIRNLTRRTLAEQTGLYPTHVSDYFSVKDNKRELPARHIAAVERVLGNTAITRAKRSTAPKLTMEQAREIRASTEGVIALGERYGVNKSLISRIKAGSAWRETVGPASIFSMGGRP